MKKGIGILFFGIIVLFFGWYFFFSKEEVTENYKDISIQDEAVQSLYKSVNPTNDYASLRDVYTKNTFSNDFILGIALVNFLREHENYTESIPEEEVNLLVNKIFGNITFAHNSGYVVSSELCTFQYDKVLHNYSYTKGCDETSEIKLVRELVSAKKSDTEYILTEKLILVRDNLEEVKKNEEEQAKLSVYNDFSENKLIKEISYNWQTETQPNVSLKDYEKEASVYEYHFEFDGNSFVYKRIQKV